MTEINSNYYVSGRNGVNTSVSTVPANNRGYGYSMQPELSLRDEFIKQHKKNGLVERFYNWVKNVTKLGTGSKKAEAAVTQAENGEISEEQARQTINKYRNSQATSAQIVGDIASIGAGSAAFFGLRRLLKMEGAAAILNEQAYKEMAKSTGKDVVEKYTVKLINIAKSNKKMTAVLAGTSAIIAGFTKLFLGKFNRIGSQEFKIDKKDFNNLQTERDRAAYKYEKKLNKRAKYRANIKNFISGAVNGALLPITLVGNAVIGVPVYLLGNTLNRYFISGTDENGKSFNGYINNLKNDSITHAALAVGAAIPLIKQGRMANVFDANLKKSFNALKNATLHKSGFEGKTVYQELDEILMGSERVSNIINERHNDEFFKIVREEAKKLSEEKGIEYEEAWDEVYNTLSKNQDSRITALTEESIFAVKFKQISKDYSALSKALRENCPVTHTMEEASEIINSAFPGKYTVTKSLGAGTIAETYLAEGPNKEQVCIKILKKGITKEKILADEKKFIDLIESLPSTKAEKDSLIEAAKSKFNTLKAEKEALIKEWDSLSYLDPKSKDRYDAIRKLEQEIKNAEEICDNSIKRIEKIPVKSKDEKEFLKRNIKNLSEGIQNEVNFEHEMQAAADLKKSTTLAKVVKGLEVKDNVYVMEKAEGISLEFFAKINALREGLRNATRRLQKEPNNKYCLGRVKEIEKELEILKAKTLNWGEITDLSPEESSKILDEYQKIKIEQFTKVGADGKIIHGDIHPGNIFFDYKTFKAGKKQYFTLIDTGNTINMTKEQALRALKLTEIVNKGSVPDIAKYVLEGATLPEGMSYEQALENITSELNKCFFDYETKLPQMTNDSVLDLTSNIMRKYKIIPNDSQLNFNKAKQSASNSFEELFEILINKKIGDFDFEEASKTEMVKKGADIATTAIGKFLKYQRMEKIQEKANLALLSPLERRKFKDNPNLLKWTDEKHITYKLKQKIKDVEGIKKEHGLDDIT